MKRAALLAFGSLCFFIVVSLCLHCTPAQSADVQRETARAALLTAADAVHALDVECARVTRATGDKELAELCIASYKATRASLVGAALVVDAWGEAPTRANITCTAVNVGHELALLARAIAGKGGRELEVTADALALVAMLGGCVTSDGGIE